MTSLGLGNGLLPGLPNNLFRSIGLGGLPLFVIVPFCQKIEFISRIARYLLKLKSANFAPLPI
jgi:hypothetical protein